MATDKRERQRANRESKITEQRKADQKESVQQRFLLFGVIAAVILGGLFLLSRAGGDDSDNEITTPLTLATTTTLSEQDAAEATGELVSAVSTPEAGGEIDGDTECPAEDGSSERVTSFSSAPPMCIDESASYSAEIVTNLGTISMELNAERAPNIVNNFVVLARYHYYDGAPFHRIIPGFIIQGGDAVGSPLGTGNPGYSVADELPEEGDYQIGSVAMANSGTDTNGSQFFVITGEQGIALPPIYSLFGDVTTGLDVVSAIESIPTVAGDSPTEPVIIESVTITEG